MALSLSVFISIAAASTILAMAVFAWKECASPISVYYSNLNRVDVGDGHVETVPWR